MPASPWGPTALQPMPQVPQAENVAGRGGGGLGGLFLGPWVRIADSTGNTKIGWWTQAALAMKSSNPFSLELVMALDTCGFWVAFGDAERAPRGKAFMGSKSYFPQPWRLTSIPI